MITILFGKKAQKSLEAVNIHPNEMITILFGKKAQKSLEAVNIHPMFHLLTSWHNLLLAYRKASRGKRSHPNVAAFEYRLEDNLYQLQAELKTQSYRADPYHSFFIHDPKRRLISAAPFRDRVVHHALCNLLEPLFEWSFIEDSYANRLGKGTHRARARYQQFATNTSWRTSPACDRRHFLLE